MSTPTRGEVWFVELGMTAKVRPAIVLSVPVTDIDRPLVSVVPHTTTPSQSRFEVSISVSFLPSGVFAAQNLVTIPHAKLVRRLGVLSSSQISVVERAVCLWLGLPVGSARSSEA